MSRAKVDVAVSGGGMGLFGAMFLLFLGLKLAGAIDWSWWWVTAPLWAPLTLLCAVALALIVFVWMFRVVRRVVQP